MARRRVVSFFVVVIHVSIKPIVVEPLKLAAVGFSLPPRAEAIRILCNRQTIGDGPRSVL